MANTNPNKSTVSVQAQAQALVSKACKAAYQQASNAAFSLPATTPPYGWARVVRLATDLLERDLARQVQDLRQAGRMRAGSARAGATALASALARASAERISLDREYAKNCEIEAEREIEAEYAKNWR